MPHLHRVLPSDPRYEIVFEKHSQRQGRSSLLGELKALTEQGGAAIGDAYALLASAILKGKERLQDQNAERRYRQRRETHAVAAERPRPPRKSPVPAK